MKKNWDLEELIEYFTFMPNELDLLKDKIEETQLGFAVLFKFFQYGVIRTTVRNYTV